MKLKKLYRSIVYVLAVFLLFFVTSCKKSADKTIFDGYQAFGISKFECADEPEKYILVDPGFGASFLDYFNGLLFEESQENMDQWLYRITYNWNEHCANCEEIVVLLGRHSMSVNGVSYKAVSEEYYSRILEQMDYFYEEYADFKKDVE